ncbi:MAG: DUF1343 domain-containing protein [Clostridia bacterium]|nr:DUF1343 domain-containing protein [Clostridia bacterium]
MQKVHVLSGIDRIDTVSSLLDHKRIGLMTNPTGVSHDLRSTIDILNEHFHLRALYAVEHGLRGDEQAGESVQDQTDAETGVPVYSTYGKKAAGIDALLESVDAVVFDIQDVGARFYTYLYSLADMMEACARTGRSLIVLDRINPLGGSIRCGTILDEHFASFVGRYALPTQYGMTIGEYAQYVKAYRHLEVDLHIAGLTGWQRSCRLDETDLPWVAPSPNCADLATALCYIGTCIFEGTNISEGRGTTQPFQVIGAPFLDGVGLEREMNEMGLPGVHFRRTSFRPTFSKYKGELCHGVQMHVLNRDAMDAFSCGIHLLDAMRRQAGDAFQFLSLPDRDEYFIDHLLGTDLYRCGKLDADGMVDAFRPGVENFGQIIRPYLLYE